MMEAKSDVTTGRAEYLCTECGRTIITFGNPERCPFGCDPE